MIKITISGIIAIVILFAVFSALPNDKTTDTKSVITNAEESYKTDKITDVGQKVIDQTGNQAIQTACKNGSSQACSTTYNSITMLSIAWTIFVVGLFVGSITCFVKWLSAVL